MLSNAAASECLRQVGWDNPVSRRRMRHELEDSEDAR